MKNGKFTSLALLSVFTVGFAQSSVVGAIVDSGGIEAATKVNSGENERSDNTVKGNGKVKTEDPSCTPQKMAVRLCSLAKIRTHSQVEVCLPGRVWV